MGFLKDISTNPAKHPNKKNGNLLCDAIAIAEGSRSCLYHICDDQNKCMAHDPNLVQGIGNFASLSFAHKICIGWSLSNSKSCCDSIFDMNLPKSINQENMRKQSITQTSRSKMVSKKARAAAACAGLGGPGPRGWIVLFMKPELTITEQWRTVNAHNLPRLALARLAFVATPGASWLIFVETWNMNIHCDGEGFTLNDFVWLCFAVLGLSFWEVQLLVMSQRWRWQPARLLLQFCN